MLCRASERCLLRLACGCADRFAAAP